MAQQTFTVTTGQWFDEPAGISAAHDFKVGDAVKVHPACDAWMQGLRHGDVVSAGPKRIRVFFPQHNVHRVFSGANLEHT